MEENGLLIISGLYILNFDSTKETTHWSKQRLLILADRERSDQMNLQDLSTRYSNTKAEWGVNPLFKFLNPSYQFEEGSKLRSLAKQQINELLFLDPQLMIFAQK